MARPKKTTAVVAPAEAPPAPDATAPIASNTVTTLPLFSLCLSDLNVRQTERDADIAALAEDIAARGLKQNLVVIPAHFSTAEPGGMEPKANISTGDPQNAERFEVVAGGRRYQAMKLLAEDGRLPTDHPVPVMVEARDQARETSLSENLHRVAMNPADEFEAFAQISATATAADPIAYTAKRFGVTQRHVRERLRLASLAPELLEALRTGAIPVDAAKAYAGTEDHALQLKVFKANEKANYNKHEPRAIREALRGATLSLNDGRVKFVGLDAYRAAGGRTETEMFMGTDGEERLTDLALLDQLCAEKAEPMLADQAKADGYGSALFAPGCGWRAKIPKPPEGMVEARHEYSSPTAAQRQQRIAIYTVDQDGDGLNQVNSFKPAQDDKPRETYKQETPEERAVRFRQIMIDLWSARLAVGPFAGTPLEGKAIWTHGYVTTDRPAGDDTDDMFVSIEIRVTAEQIAAQREAAVIKVAEIEADEARRKAEREAARAAEADDDDETGEFEDEDFDEEDA